MNLFESSKNLKNTKFVQHHLPAIGLITIAFSLTLATMSDVGITWDEPEHNFSNSLRQVQWFTQAIEDISRGYFFRPFKKETITEYWGGNYHPTLARTFSGMSWFLFNKVLGDIVAFRLSSSIMFALLVGLLYVFISQAYSWKEGLFAACAYLLMPRVFGHAHIAALDTAITFMWFTTAYAFWRGTTNSKWGILTGVIYGAALATKIHALFIPIPLLLWGILTHREKICLNNFLAMVIIAPIVAFLIQPWLWNGTFSQLSEKLISYTHRSITGPIPLYYLGKVYHFSPPWHYPFVMAVVTVPPGIVLSYVIALIHVRFHTSIILLLGLNAFTSLSLLLLPTAPGYDGVRLFLPAFPFLAGLAGIGFGQCLEFPLRHIKLWRCFVRNQTTYRIFAWILIILLLGSSIFSLIDAHPYFLSYFNLFIGGVKGAQQSGMESTYWGDSINQPVLDYLNTYIGKEASVAFLAYNPQIAQYYRKRNMLRREIKSELKADYWVLNASQSAFSPLIWLLYKWVRPLREFSYREVPLVLVFRTKDVAHQLGFITQWKVVGPFNNRANQGFCRMTYPPEQKIDLDATYEGLDQQVSWQPVLSQNPLGLVDLTQVYGQKAYVIAYAFTQIKSPTSKNVQLRIKTDDGIKIWVNGRKISTIDVPLEMTDDAIPVKFEKGINTLLLKIPQKTDFWAFTIQVTTPNGDPVPVKYATENYIESTHDMLKIENKKSF